MQSIDLVILLFNIFSVVSCLPTVQSGSETKPEFKDEKRYPNGTVIGTYTYIDKEGTPVHVQYYADNNSYGVELKSVKVYNEAEPKDFDLFAKTMETPLKVASDLLKYDFDRVHDVYRSKQNEIDKIDNNLKSDKKKGDYEVLYNNGYNSLKNNAKNKIKIYSGKEKRKTRNIRDDYDKSLFCYK
ncbi:cuticular protein RR-3 motif 147 isoform X1 [Bombyx mori]|uniref:Cuticle protein n=1 Tax=Bombyx mori TaxID=7091 RepID=A0A8R2AL61_BOMMO|nr:uncharacterized protein LOC101742561 isoform X1 [Bombyx mori]